ncbi:hypothetical protein [Sulfurovum sp.]|uniref:hypothetical protein n=1 Tax=Sulfurovum sp. TaxID=1969726 RepID=UPI00356743A2
MRGSVYYHSAELTKVIFQEGLKKEDRSNPNSEYYQMVSSYKTMESYRSVWNNFFNYLREHWQLKRYELISVDHVIAYMDYKIGYYPSHLYLAKINSAMGKLEVALNRYSAINDEFPQQYDFSKRLEVFNSAKDLELVAKSYHNRAYQDPMKIIQNLAYQEYQLAAQIQLEGGARLEGVCLIREEQLKGFRHDSITNKTVGVIETKEKGGKVGDILVSLNTYDLLTRYLSYTKIFKISKSNYMNDIRQTAKDLSLTANGSHGFRWNFAQRRLFEYAQAGYTYEQSLLLVSSEMKHNRASITEHYLGA